MADARNVEQLSDRASELRAALEDLEGRLATDASLRAARAA